MQEIHRDVLSLGQQTTAYEVITDKEAKSMGMEIQLDQQLKNKVEFSTL